MIKVAKAYMIINKANFIYPVICAWFEETILLYFIACSREDPGKIFYWEAGGGGGGIQYIFIQYIL